MLQLDEDREQLNYVKLFLEEMEKSLKIESIGSPDEIPSMLLNDTFDAILMNFRIVERKGIEFNEKVQWIKEIPLVMYRGSRIEAVADTNLRVAKAHHEMDQRHFRVLADRLIAAVNKNREIRDQKISLKVLEALASGSDRQSTLGEVLEIIRGSMDVDAVGIRLQEGDDYPYFVFDGFHDEYIILENALCAIDLEGQMMRDDGGNPILDCMCGNILRGRFDPSKPFFTEGGSFWTNSSTEHLASTTVEDRLVKTRNTCQGEGYESVALIPIRDEGETIGLLLQLNDRRPGCFNEETIGFLEGLGKVIGGSLGRDNRGRGVLKELELARETLRSAPIPSLIIDPDDMSILGASYSATQMTGVPLEELRGIPCYEALKGYKFACEDYGEECPLMQMLESRGQTSTTLTPLAGGDGEGRFVEETASPIRGPDGAIELAYLMVREDPGLSREISRMASPV